MKCRPVVMFVPPALEFLLFLCTIGLSEAAPRINAKDASPAERHPRAVSETTSELQNTSMPNHLPEEKFGDGTIAVLTPATATTVATRTSVSTVQPATTITLSATTAPLKTVEPITKTRDAAANTKPRTETDSVLTTYIESSTLLSTTALSTVETQQTKVSSVTNSWFTEDSAPPIVTTTESGQELSCNCSGEGVQDPYECDGATGQCSCLSGYTGLQCEDCEEGHFSNGSTGCLPCGCDSYGAIDDHCDSSGACTCKPGVFGPKCDDCHPGFFRFSSTGCQPCQCNNHSNDCHPQSGICLDCQGNTEGPNCQECRKGFYRRLGAAPTDTCLACPCSNVTSTGSCYVDSSGHPVCDECKPEYQGLTCNVCRDGFYSLDGVCLRCECNGNADPLALPRLCHPETGHCLSCTNNTAGPHCEVCAPGFSGDALTHTCTPTAVRVLPTVELRTTTTSPTTPPSGSTMASTTANSTRHMTTPTTQTLLTSLNSPTDNTTATISEVSWTQFNVIILAVIIVVVVLLMGVAGGVYTYREYQNRKLNAPFWTIELKEDNISFSSYHDSIPNADVSGLLEDEASEAAPNGQLALTTPINMYKP
ncbi:multiple epidermal growth factor-like domains protein 9 isoform X1 [Megalops cyprinoides]|uniref:multiple epidermal growth factor-like domains protein 9 isoform X1 n=1 Tax=Megalops cyprinoides TaxID=118141 RepID=UPI001864076F|nr:multiple epidermal growth factor-like domains protein 9 isoform X1 [Megalops cyprinoides]